MAEEAAHQAAAAAEASQLRAQLASAEAAAAAAEQQAATVSAQLVEAQQALIDADRCVVVWHKGCCIGRPDRQLNTTKTDCSTSALLHLLAAPNLQALVTRVDVHLFWI